MTTHLQNPKAPQIPLCRYLITLVEKGVDLEKLQYDLTSVVAEVTCQHCKRRLGLLPKPQMPSVKCLFAKRRRLLGY